MKTNPKAKRTIAQAPTEQSAADVTTEAALPQALKQFDLLPGSAHVRLPTVASLFAASPATIVSVAPRPY